MKKRWETIAKLRMLLLFICLGGSRRPATGSWASNRRSRHGDWISASDGRLRIHECSKECHSEAIEFSRSNRSLKNQWTKRSDWPSHLIF
jgi:hypothetical protein